MSMGMGFSSFRDSNEEMIERMVDEMYPTKMGFSFVNEDERDAYRRGLQQGLRFRGDD